jgi:hypothetical protein
MNGEGWQSDQGSGASKDDNVVRLTDWLGPREEFVPFGSRADAADEAAAGSVPTAEDFWSETSAAVQDPLTAPHHEPSRAHLTRASAAAMWSRRRAQLAGSRPPRATDRHSRPLAAISVLAAAALAAVFAAGLGSGAHFRGRLADLGSAGQSAATRRTVTPSFGAQVHRLRAGRPVAHRASRSRSAVRRSMVHRVRHRGRATPASAATGQPVGYTTPAPTSTSSLPAQSAPASNPTTSAPAATTAGSQASRSGPQPALGANGSLAPGSSPDG